MVWCFVRIMDHSYLHYMYLKYRGGRHIQCIIETLKIKNNITAIQILSYFDACCWRLEIWINSVFWFLMSDIVADVRSRIALHWARRGKTSVVLQAIAEMDITEWSSTFIPIWVLSFNTTELESHGVVHSKNHHNKRRVLKMQFPYTSSLIFGI